MAQKKQRKNTSSKVTQQAEQIIHDKRYSEAAKAVATSLLSQSTATK